MTFGNGSLRRRLVRTGACYAAGDPTNKPTIAPHRFSGTAFNAGSISQITDWGYPNTEGTSPEASVARGLLKAMDDDVTAAPTPSGAPRGGETMIARRRYRAC